jgi:hypothetical protein
MKRTKRGHSECKDESSLDDPLFQISSTEMTDDDDDDDDEPVAKKPKQQHQQTAPLFVPSTSTAQIQVLECDDLVCVIMTVC